MLCVIVDKKTKKLFKGFLLLHLASAIEMATVNEIETCIDKKLKNIHMIHLYFFFKKMMTKSKGTSPKRGSIGLVEI